MSTKGRPNIRDFSLRRLWKAGSNNPRVAMPELAKRYKVFEVIFGTSLGILLFVFWPKH